MIKEQVEKALSKKKAVIIVGKHSKFKVKFDKKDTELIKVG